MGFVHGKGTVVTIGGDDMTVFSTSCEYELKAEAHETTTFGHDYKVFSGGLIESTMKVEGQYDDAADTGPAAVLEPLIGKVTEMVYKPEGATGLSRTFDALLTQYTETSPVNDMIKFAAEFQGTDAVAVAPGTP
ncbi:MAG TPA: hypothetical protein VIU11_14460 [Nakamurella sp.]